MIKSFKELPGDIQELQQSHAAEDLKDLSIPVSGRASDVEITDYH